MRNIAVIASIFGAFLIAAPLGDSQSSSPSQGQSLVVIFKDGHQQSFAVSEIARIEIQPSAAFSAGQNRFLGEWKVGDCIGGYFKITLNRNGDARKTNGSPQGTWTVVDGEARVSWEDGWHDVIRRLDNNWEKAAYAPGRSFAEGPSCTASAESTEHKPI